MRMKNIYKILLAGVILCLSFISDAFGQPVPGLDENIPFLVTFGKNGETSWGDDDFSQTFFFAIPEEFKDRFYIRVFDPETGGMNDELKGPADTRMMYSVYGGKGVDPDVYEESQGDSPTGGYKSGTLIASKIFGSDKQYDNKYYTFGPFIATQGEYNKRWKSYIFKVICDGVSGDDGNLYKYFLSREQVSDVPIVGANAFTYEYTFRMWNDVNNVSHLYPFIDTGIVSVKQTNFDWDDDGDILVVSRVRQGKTAEVSGQNDTKTSQIEVDSLELNSSLDFQFHKKKEYLVKNNNVVISLRNQRNQGLKLYGAPIGGVPTYEGKIGVKQATKKVRK
jgi:hypothetical protein